MAAESVTLKAQNREGRGSRLAQKLRARGEIPGVIYGHKLETVSVTLPGEELTHAIRHGTRVLDLQTPAGTEKVLIREVQWDHLGKELLHVDFARVSADERIHVSVPVEIKGTAPGVAQGGLVNQPIHTLHVECLAISIPESIRVNIGELQVGQAIHVRELKLPEGVKALDDAEAIIVQVSTPAAEPETAEEAAQAEPEVIGRVKGEEEAEKE